MSKMWEGRKWPKFPARKNLLLIILLAVIGTQGIGLALLYSEYLTLEQQYQWALELSKLTPEQREKILEEIRKQTDI